MNIAENLNVVRQCRKYQIGLWSCPQFLFIVMGVVIILSIFVTSFAANRFSEDPVIAIVSVTMVTVILFILGHTVVMSFERVADAARAQAEFVSIVSHQLRTPLSAVRWQLDVIEERLKKGNTDVQSLIDTVQDENNRVIKLVSALLQVNRIQENRVALHMERLSLWDMTEKIAKDYQTFAGVLKIDLITEREDAADEYAVRVDDGKIRWIIENLIDNAIRYSNNGGTVRIRLSSDRKGVKWEISDQGIGIPKAEQKKIFQKFYRASNAQKVQTEGSGLGLFVVMSYVEAMGGKMAFNSREGVGTTFSYVLPRALMSEDART